MSDRTVDPTQQGPDQPEPTPAGVWISIEPVEAAPPGVYRYMIGCPHREPFTSEVVPAYLTLVIVNGERFYSRIPDAPYFEPKRPEKAALVNFYMGHMASHHAADFEQCPCWRQAAMRYGPEHHTTANLAEAFSRE